MGERRSGSTIQEKLTLYEKDMKKVKPVDLGKRIQRVYRAFQ